MAYKIESLSMIEFVDDTRITLPRFQRKETWDAFQNFKLCISVFKNFPIGVVIINKDGNSSWLLDGRQRRNALKQMRDNPNKIYEWATKFLKIKSTMEVLEVKSVFWSAIEEYLNNQNDDKETYSSNENEDENSDERAMPASFDPKMQQQGLQTLLDIILMVHSKKKDSGRWERIFDFKKLFKKLPYVSKNIIEPSLLRKFILDLYASGNSQNLDSINTYFCDKSYIEPENEGKFLTQLSTNEKEIMEIIDTIVNSENIFKEARLALIEISKASPIDAQNIFSLVNSGGTQLKAEELLSAKPFWTVEIDLSSKVKLLVNELYRKLGVASYENYVRWDLVATVLDRIDNRHLIFKEYSSEKMEIEQISVSFRLIATLFASGMSAKHINELEKLQIDWERDIDEKINDINQMIEVLLTQSTFFKYLHSIKKSIQSMLGNAIALEFLAITLIDWSRKDKPTVDSNKMKSFVRNSAILFDRLVFEYATKKWRGSGDSTMAADIKSVDQRFIPVTQADWIDFVNSACNGSYKGSPTSQKLLTPVLIYFFALREIMPNWQTDMKIEIDHIIPKERLKNNANIDEQFIDSLSNLSLIPKKENISKGSSFLNELTSTSEKWLIDLIHLYSDIDFDEFPIFSSITNKEQIITNRKEKLLKLLNEKRAALMVN